ncbi:anthranilate synthase component I family protein [Roseburia inulinivorans]|jgi:anthranilate synthase component 1|uniref:Anthranilate synthase component 1 n=1 Tax=Roseburia inulinivorans TaxID=360807 RepID=A0A3R6GLB5_9FIRM|nr:anthranilate synthase component I family protein [Roseburia inulinivorans]RHF86767.1 anthranilate synthase component I family protein [Roseburia inulinivorans]
MKIMPALAEVKKIASEAKYNVLPVSFEMLSDFITPIETMRILKNVSTHCYMLESAQSNETWGRYTFLGFDPKLEITCVNGEMKIGNLKVTTEHPSDYLRQILADYKSPRFDYLPSFTGGLVGYFSYDYLGYSEPGVKCDVEDTENFKDLDLMLFDKVIAFDHLRQKIILIVNMPLADVEVGYNKAVMELKQLAELLRNGEKKNEPGGRLTGEVTPLFDKEQFCNMVEKAKHHIREGDIFQIVLSNRLSAPFEGSLFNTYRVLRTINPSPYMFYFSGTDVEVAGASPETLVKLENGVLHTFPLAGTRPRGKNAEEDKALEKELLADEKELSEHNMLVDLGRNDLGKISRFGTVQVEKLHSIERFSHVMHIGSTVRGEIDEKHDAFDAIEAVLPAGTLSGAPKIRACQLIGELENNKRGIYGGAIGYIDFTGNMDTCIAIRIAYKKNGKVFVRSGAGIVADSVPEKEFEECINKAKASLKALELAQEVEG